MAKERASGVRFVCRGRWTLWSESRFASDDLWGGVTRGDTKPAGSAVSPWCHPPAALSMPHGWRHNVDKCKKPYTCVVCKAKQGAESPLVMFRNDNNREYAPGRVLWDACCADCADKYKIPPPPMEKRSVSNSASMMQLSTSRGGFAPAMQGEEGSHLVADPQQTVALADDQLFLLAEFMGVPRWRAEQLRDDHGGDADAAGAEILRILGIAADEEADAVPSAPIPQPKPQRDMAADGLLPRAQPAMRTFGTDEARRATADIYFSAVAPLLPRPQRDGTLAGGDLAKLQSMLSTPIVLSLPRPELRGEACRPCATGARRGRNSNHGCSIDADIHFEWWSWSRYIHRNW